MGIDQCGDPKQAKRRTDNGHATEINEGGDPVRKKGEMPTSMLRKSMGVATLIDKMIKCQRTRYENRLGW